MKNVATRVLLMTSVMLTIVYFSLLWIVRAPVFLGSSLVPMQALPSPITLKTHVLALTDLLPNRSVSNPESLSEAAIYIEEAFASLGYETERQYLPIEGLNTYNVIAKFVPQGVPDNSSWIVVGAHYDVAGKENPGADDNASGVAGLLELAAMFKANSSQIKFPIEFVAYTTEEPPYFAGDQMGSAIHAKTMHEEKQGVRLMYSLEMIGYFSDEIFSQKFPVPLLYLYYPWRGNFIGLISNMENKTFIKDVKKSFNAIEDLSTFSINAPEQLVGIDFSDHRNYWKYGWPAIMVTDTSFYRNEQYHLAGDTADRLDYEKMALVVMALFQSISDLN